MKKFYTMLCAAFVGTLVASAVKPATIATEMKKEFNVANTEASLQRKLINPNDVMPVSEDLLDGVVDITGEKLFTGVMNDKSVLKSTTVAKTGENDYALQKFIYSDVNDLPGVVTVESYDGSDGQPHYYYQYTIKGNKQTVYFSDEGEDYTLMLFQYKNGSPTVYTNDLEFMVMADGSLMFLYENCGIAWLNSQMRGNWIDQLDELSTPSAYASYTVSQGNSEEVITDEPCLVVLYEEGDEAAITVQGLFGWYNDKVLEFGIDKTESAIYNEDELYICDLTTQAGESYPFYLVSDFGQQYSMSVAAKCANVEGEEKCIATFEDNLMCYNPELGWYEKYSNAVINIAMNLPGMQTVAGIENVTVDAAAAANAPVEYFNLQGIRVENPAAGIFIRRQGNTVTKIKK